VHQGAGLNSGRGIDAAMDGKTDIPLAESAHTVLAIDDDQNVHRLLKARLKQENFELATAQDGATGLRMAMETPTSLILLDLDMPEMDGYEVLRRLKESKQTHDIPVIVLSGMPSPADKVTAFDLGAVDYMTKPFDMMELRVRVRSALRMADLVQMLAQRAHIDGLTGLYNRVAFDERWKAATAENRRHGRPLSVALFDLDHFKSINDTYGHPAGDEALRTFGKLLRRESRESDIACRYGGEEFVLIMPETAPEDAVTFCDRVRVKLSELQWPMHPERSVTVSVGVAGAIRPATAERDAWLTSADTALYTSKRSGRNRVTAVHVEQAQAKLAG
jgi:diguanylate cyclase (GGDEF)-like protein